MITMKSAAEKKTTTTFLSEFLSQMKLKASYSEAFLFGHQSNAQKSRIVSLMKIDDICDWILNIKNPITNSKMTNKSQDIIPIKYALLKAKCARCRKGDMFKSGILNQKMHERCTTCDLYFERHPGYFYVSMFVSYALAVAEIVTLSLATFIISGGSENVYLYLLIILSAVVILSPFNYKFSRVLQMHFLDPGLKYQPDFAQKYFPKVQKDLKSKEDEILVNV